jgi:hypothetical protein
MASSLLHTALHITSQHRPHRKHHSFIVMFASIATKTCLLNRCLKMGVFFSIQFNLFHPRIILHDMGQVKDQYLVLI